MYVEFFLDSGLIQTDRKRKQSATPLSLSVSAMNSSDSQSINGDSTNASTADFNYGFRRPEMYKTPLAGTVDAYDRHVFLCYRNPENWPHSVEDPESDPLPRLLAAALKSNKNSIHGKVDFLSNIYTCFLHCGSRTWSKRAEL